MQHREVIFQDPRARINGPLNVQGKIPMSAETVYFAAGSGETPAVSGCRDISAKINRLNLQDAPSGVLPLMHSYNIVRHYSMPWQLHQVTGHPMPASDSKGSHMQPQQQTGTRKAFLDILHNVWVLPSHLLTSIWNSVVLILQQPGQAGQAGTWG